MRDILAKLLPRLPAEYLSEYAPILESAMAEFEINTPLRKAAFLAQILHESGGLSRWEENLTYSAEGLRKTWPARFIDADTAARYARKPERIASRVYADRMGNGPESSGDGWRFRGRGPPMLTGRANYRAFGKKLGLDLEALPDQVATPQVGFHVAAAFWDDRKLNPLADEENIVGITKRINGGLTNLADRKEWYAKAKTAFGLT